MPMDVLQERRPWWKPLLMGASPITALSHWARKTGFQVHFKECPWLWIAAYLARDLCRSNSKWKNVGSLRLLPAGSTGNNLKVTWGNSPEPGGLRSEGHKGHLTHPFLSCGLWTLAKRSWELRNAWISYQLSQSEATFWEGYENPIAKFYWNSLQGIGGDSSIFTNLFSSWRSRC